MIINKSTGEVADPQPDFTCYKKKYEVTAMAVYEMYFCKCTLHTFVKMETPRQFLNKLIR